MTKILVIDDELEICKQISLILSKQGYEVTYANSHKEFVDLAIENGIIGINGHRSVGGIRVSLFNSVDDDMFEYFMNFFKKYINESK